MFPLSNRIHCPRPSFQTFLSIPTCFPRPFTTPPYVQSRATLPPPHSRHPKSCTSELPLSLSALFETPAQLPLRGLFPSPVPHAEHPQHGNTVPVHTSGLASGSPQWGAKEQGYAQILLVTEATGHSMQLVGTRLTASLAAPCRSIGSAPRPEAWGSRQSS